MDVDRGTGGRDRGGFTLVEMLAAMMILAFGITTVLGVMSAGLATERNSELIRDASRLATAVREDLEHGGMAGTRDEAELQDIIGGRLPDFPDLQYDLRYETVDLDGRVDYVCRIRVRWLRGGSDVAEDFEFPLPRSKALYLRIRDELERSKR